MIHPYLLAIVIGYWSSVGLALSILATLVHAAEEWRGEGGPLWEYLSRITGAKIAPALGVVLVGVLTPAWCVTLAVLAYACESPCWAMALAGARLGDCLATHWLPAWHGWRPNPGLPTTALYAAEATAILAVVLSLPAPPGPGWLLLGGLPFLALWPALSLSRRLSP